MGVSDNRLQWGLVFEEVGGGYNILCTTVKKQAISIILGGVEGVERSLKAGPDVIDYKSWRRTTQDFLRVFLQTCNAEKLHIAGWAVSQGRGSQVMGRR